MRSVFVRLFGKREENGTENKFKENNAAEKATIKSKNSERGNIVKEDSDGASVKNKLAVLAIIISDFSAAEKVNAVLHEFGEYAVARLGVPYKARGVNVISVILDAPQDKISSLSGKLGMIAGVTSKVLTTK